MLDKGELKKLAHARLDDARVLFDAARYDGAVYLCGYAVELALKHRICRTLNWLEFPDNRHEFKSFKTHKLDVLLRLSGVELRISTKYFAEWSAVSNWDPDARYRPIGQVTRANAELMLDSATVLVKRL